MQCYGQVADTILNESTLNVCLLVVLAELVAPGLAAVAELELAGESVPVTAIL